MLDTHPVWQVDVSLISNELQDSTMRASAGLAVVNFEQHGVLDVQGSCSGMWGYCRSFCDQLS